MVCQCKSSPGFKSNIRVAFSHQSFPHSPQHNNSPSAACSTNHNHTQQSTINQNNMTGSSLSIGCLHQQHARPLGTWSLHISIKHPGCFLHLALSFSHSQQHNFHATATQQSTETKINSLLPTSEHSSLPAPSASASASASASCSFSGLSFPPSFHVSQQLSVSSFSIICFFGP